MHFYVVKNVKIKKLKTWHLNFKCQVFNLYMQVLSRQQSQPFSFSYDEGIILYNYKLIFTQS